MRKYPSQPPRKVAEDLWEISGGWSNKLGRRMTVIRLADGSLLVHNAFELSPDEMEWLQSLSDQGVSKIVAPNTFHCSDASWMHRRFPKAELYVPQSKQKSFAGALDVNRDFADTVDLKCIPMVGSSLEEAAFFHVPTATLVLTDAAFNMPPVFTGLEKWFMDWNKVGGRFGPSRLTRWMFCRDQKQLLGSYQQLLELPFDRVIVNHGDILESGGRHLLRDGLKAVFPSWSKNDP